MTNPLSSLGRHKSVITILIVIAATMIVIGILTSSDAATDEATDSIGAYERTLEERITKLCLCVDGIDEASVLVTAQSETAPYSQKDTSPNIRGVAAVVTNGDDAAVQKTVTELISAALGIPTNRVSVAACRTKNEPSAE